MNFNTLSVLAIVASIGLASCTEPSQESLTLNINGLENLGTDYAYEGWVMIDGSPVSTGIFTVNDNGDLSDNSFEVDKLEEATAFILTIEPSPDNDPAPSDVHIIAGDFSTDNASLTVGHPAALGHDLSSAAGGFIIATPTDMLDTNENSGIWFLDNSSGSAMAGLDLPVLPSGWEYEGWVVIDGQPVTTGKFTSSTGADQQASFSGDNPGPPYPGEDFLNNAPAGLSFPTDIRGGTAVISVEPVPDNATAPFALKPLVKAIEAGAQDHSFIGLDNNAVNTNPTGTATR